MQYQKLSRKEKALANFSVNDLLVYLASKHNPDDVLKIAKSCGFSSDSISVACNFSKDFHEHGKVYFEERLIHWRNVYYRHNELKHECPSKIKHKSLINRLILSGRSYRYTAIKSIEILERFAGGRLLIKEPSGILLFGGNSFLDYVKSNECYGEELVLYFENIPELFFSLSFHDNLEERLSPFMCYIHTYSIDNLFDVNGYIRLSCQSRKYYDVPEYFNNRFMQFMSRAILTSFFDSQHKDSIAYYLSRYLKSKDVVLPDLQYTCIMQKHNAKTPTEQMMIEYSANIKSVDLLVKRVVEFETKRGVLDHHLTLLKLYLNSFVLERRALLNKWIQEENLKSLEKEYYNILK